MSYRWRNLWDWAQVAVGGFAGLGHIVEGFIDRRWFTHITCAAAWGCLAAYVWIARTSRLRAEDAERRLIISLTASR